MVRESRQWAKFQIFVVKWSCRFWLSTWLWIYLYTVLLGFQQFLQRDIATIFLIGIISSCREQHYYCCASFSLCCYLIQSLHFNLYTAAISFVSSMGTKHFRLKHKVNPSIFDSWKKKLIRLNPLAFTFLIILLFFILFFVTTLLLLLLLSWFLPALLQFFLPNSERVQDDIQNVYRIYH